MKKFILSLAALLLCGSTLTVEDASAGDGVWKRNKSWGVGYVTSTLLQNNGSIGSEFGVATDLMKTYVVTPKPIGGIMKIGVDAKWLDINYVKYKNSETYYIDPDDYPYFDPDDYPYYDEDDFDIGSHNLDIGLGIGPSFQFAPFANKGNALGSLRADLFAHFTPSFSMLTLKENGETDFYYGFNPVWNFGLNIQWKMLGIGFEGRWGFPKYSNLNDMFDEWDDGENYYPGEKSSNNIKTRSFRVFLRLCF